MTTLRHILQVYNCQDTTAQLCTRKVKMLNKSELMRICVSPVIGAVKRESVGM